MSVNAAKVMVTSGVMIGKNKGAMAAAKKKRIKKHIPQRTCVGCRQVLEKRALIRIVRTPEGVIVDLEGKMNGRGAYLHDRRSCWKIGLRGSLAHSLKVELSVEDRESLAAHMDSLPAQTETAPVS